MNISKRLFGVHEGRDVDIYTLTNDNGMSASIITFGGAINKLLVPDRCGKLADVVCGFDDLKGYEESDGYQGALIGRVGNRIANGKFTLDGVDYQLYCQNGECSLHGGKVGFSHKVWDAEARVENGVCLLDLYYTSADGEENYPGTLKVHVTYALSADNALSITYRAETDKKTIINLTNHSYFNLGGFASGKIFDHELWMDADSFVVTDEGLIPTGEIRSVEGTPFDFRVAKTIGRDFDLSFEPMRLAGGYDHSLNFVCREDPMKNPRIRAYEAKSGRVMEVYTTEPCVQLYTGNFMKNPDYAFKGGYPQATQNAFCLETQKMPDSINHSNFTDCTLDVGEKFESTTTFKFSVK